MGKTLSRAALLAVLAGAGVAEAASATVYVNKRYCGGNSFATCAAVMLDVTGTTVSLRVWNLSGNPGATRGFVSPANTVFQGIGLYNVPAPINVLQRNNSPLSTSGPARPGNSPGNWLLRQNGVIGFLIDFGAVSGRPPSMDNGIASGCANPSTLPTTRGIDLYLNPCGNPTGASLSDWVTFTFQVNQHWDATNTYFSIRGRNGINNNVTECATGPLPDVAVNCFQVQVVPEPMTMALLATGLVGLGGVGYIRRRRGQQA